MLIARIWPLPFLFVIKNDIFYAINKKYLQFYFHTMYLTAISKGINLFVHDYFLFARLVRLFDLSVILCRLTLHVILVSRLLSQRPPMAKRYKFSEEQFSTT